MEQTASFIVERNGSARLSDEPVVTENGEGTLEIALYDEFSRLLAEEGRRHGMRAVARMALTNLTTAHLESVTARLGEVAGVSVDGPPEAHDAMRVYPDGKGTYGDVVRGLGCLRAAGHPFGVFATITASYPQVADVYFHLFETGADLVVVKPVRCKPDRSYSIAQNLDDICIGYERLAERLLALPDAELLQCLLRICGIPHSEDYFGRFLVRVIERHPPLDYRCPAWFGGLTVDTDGALYACDSLAGVQEACLGSVWEGVDEARVQEMTECLHISQREPCNRCWARGLCGGGCPHQSWLTHGLFEPPDPSECKLNQHLIELAIWMYSELRSSRPQVLAAMPRSARAGWRGAPVQACHPWPDSDTPALGAARLRRRSPCSIVDPGSHLRRRLRSGEDDYRLEVRLAYDSLYLLLLLTPRGIGPRDLRARTQEIRIDLAIPKQMLGWAQAMLPPLMSDQRWRLAIASEDDQLKYVETPTLEFIGRPIRGRFAKENADGWLIGVPWSALRTPAPAPGMEFGLQLTLGDSGGGELEWFPCHHGGRVSLLAQG